MPPQSSSQSIRGSATKPHPWRLHALLIILLWLITLWLWLLPRDPDTIRLVRRYYQQRIRQERVHALRARLPRDPPLGSKMVSVPLSNSTVLLIITSKLDKCQLNALDSWHDFSKSTGIRVALVYIGSKAVVEHYAKGNPSLRSRLLSAQDVGVTGKWNVVFTPRAYLLRRDGTLAWLQKETGVLYPARLERILQEGGIIHETYGVHSN